MKKIRVVLLTLVAILSLCILASCGSNAKVDIINVTPMRTRIGVTAIVKDSKNDITAGSIKARLYSSNDALISTNTFDELDEKEQTVTFNDLSKDTTYKLVVKATIDGKSKTIYSKSVKTTDEGSSIATEISIKTKEDFLNMTYDNDAYYKLENDLDFTKDDGSYGSFTTMFNKTTQFVGRLDGNNKTISGLDISNANVYMGIFGYIGAAGEIRDLNIKNVKLETTKSSELYLGTLAGCNEGTIKDVNIDGVTISHKGATSTQQYVGGLVGVNTNIIDNCSVNNVKMDLRSRYQSIVGGFVGTNGGVTHTAGQYAYIANCAATGIDITTEFSTVSSPAKDDKKEYIQYTGGFVGETRVDIKNSYSDAKIKSTVSSTGGILKLFEVSLGGFAGRVINGCKIENIAAVSQLDVVSSEAYEVYVGVVAGSAYDSKFNNCYAALKNENKIINKANYTADMIETKPTLVDQDVVDMFATSFDVIGKRDDVLDTKVSEYVNVLIWLVDGATIEPDQVDDPSTPDVDESTHNHLYELDDLGPKQVPDIRAIKDFIEQNM